MLTVNANENPVMKQFHRPVDEKRTPVVLAEIQFDDWLNADVNQAMGMMNWEMMPSHMSPNTIYRIEK